MNKLKWSVSCEVNQVKNSSYLSSLSKKWIQSSQIDLFNFLNDMKKSELLELVQVK